jgi:hypothetical protein
MRPAFEPDTPRRVLQMKWAGRADRAIAALTTRAYELTPQIEESSVRLARRSVGHLARRSVGTLPPFSASFCMTCLCSHLFMGPVSFILPV